MSNHLYILNHFPPLTFIQNFRYTADGVDVINKITFQIIQLAFFLSLQVNKLKKNPTRMKASEKLSIEVEPSDQWETMAFIDSYRCYSYVASSET